MPAPRVFISSTCYDLKYIRENLKFFVKSLGYEPILSEEGSIFYDPKLHVQDACIAEVPSCQLLVLIIGGRHGSEFKEGDKSITNREFIEAVNAKLPVFALVEQGVYDQHFVYQSNLENEFIDVKKINYPSVDSTRIFAFISEVQSQSINNALIPFSDFESIQSYLKQQWASMFQRFLAVSNEEDRVTDVLKEITKTNKNIEFLSRQLVQSIGDSVTQIRVKIYDYLINEKLAHDLGIWDIKINPDIFLENETLDDLCQNAIQEDRRDSKHYSPESQTYGGPPYRAGDKKIEQMRDDFKKIKKDINELLKSENITKDDFSKGSNKPIHPTPKSGAADG